jgi:host factor-I protein
MADKPLSLQDQFLNSIRKHKIPVTIFLVKGVKLQGIVTWFDPFSLLLRRDGNAQLVYKHAISTIMPTHPPTDLQHPGGEGGNGKKLMLQDLFLQAASREHEPMTIFLVNGVMLQGAVAGFDQFSLLLERSGQVQLVYKHAISTMQPGHPLDLAGEAQSEDES